MITSLDPRVKRLTHIGVENANQAKPPLDQLTTFEVFVQPKEGKPFQHEGIVHSSTLEMAYVLAKETFTRRFTCISLYVADTRSIYASPTTEGDVNAYDVIDTTSLSSGNKESFEIYHLMKRGKQHVHAGTVIASTPEEALLVAKEKFNSGKTVYNVWAIRTNDIRFTTQEEKDLWLTLPEKKFRDAAEYKGGDKLKQFLEKMKN
jgi:ring-1,2-phenylacetyl-CoA epoxidase subunit PaaB